MSSLGLEPFINACAGGVSASVAKFLVYPLDFFKLRLSVRAADETVGTILSKTVAKHGIFGVYMGLGPRLVRTGAQKLFYFYFYELLLQLYKLTFPAKPIGVAMNLVVGFVADTCCLPVVVPLELLSMQQSEGETMGAVIRQVYAKSGWSGFCKIVVLSRFARCLAHPKCITISDQGWSGYIWGGVMPAMQNTAFDQLKRIWLLSLGTGADNLSAAAGFIIGAIARSVADIISYPVRVPQNIQQSSVHPLRDASFGKIVGSVLKEEGLGGLYKGIIPQLSQGVLGTAIMMALKERTEGATRTLMFAAFARR